MSESVPPVPAAVPVLETREAAAVRRVAAQAAAADGVAPLNEAGLLALAGPVAPRLHVVVTTAAGEVAGYVGIDTGERPATAEVVVAPAERRAGVGATLVSAARAALGPDTPVGFWAHGDLPAARALARSAGLSATRRLARMLRPEGTPLPDVPLPPGVRLARFRPGTDDDAWLRVNAAAFAGHPEQGRWTRTDLQARLDADWFDPAGFLLAWDDGADATGHPAAAGAERLLGSNWTKLTGPQSPGGSLVGEIYVLGADPAARRPGLGTALAVAGLRSLANRGAGGVELYVEADSPAVRLYRRLGFVDDTLDVLYA
jgi:mycothiol synthase